MHFNQLLGVRVVDKHDDGVTVECPVREDLLNPRGVVHGGVTTSVADSAMGIALTRHFGREQSVTTIELKINFLRPVVEGKIVARARIVRAGRRICVGRVDVSNGEGKAIAVALMTFAVLEAGAGAPSRH